MLACANIELIQLCVLDLAPAGSHVRRRKRSLEGPRTSPKMEQLWSRCRSRYCPEGYSEQMEEYHRMAAVAE